MVEESESKCRVRRPFKNHSRRLIIFSVLCLLLICGGIMTFAGTASPRSGVEVEGIEYYVALDDEWHRIDVGKTVPGRDRNADGSYGRFYTTPETLEEYYGRFGFRADDYEGERLFPHSAGTDTGQIWADSTAQKTISGNWKIPLANNSKIYVYYLPANTEGHESYFEKNKSLSDEALLSDNMFYSVTISDPDKKAPELEDVTYHRSGSAYTVTLPADNGYEWECVNYDSFEQIIPDSVTRSDDGQKVTLTFDEVRQPMKIKPVNPVNTRLKIVYDAGTVEENLQMLNEVSAGIQSVETDGSINGSETYTFVLNASDTSYRALYPDHLKALVRVPSSSQNKKYWYVFKGWNLGNTDTVIDAGSTMSIDDMKQYEINGEIHLNAVWSGRNDNTRIGSANFYVNKTCEISDNMTDGFLENPKENFTKAIYTAKLNESDPTPVDNRNDTVLIAAETGKTAYDVDSKIRNMAEAEYRGVSMEEFPSDEDVLASLRKNNEEIRVGDQVIPVENLTTANFKVRWYVVKYAHADGWHVDGILVAKAAKLVVKKTFAGSADAAIDALEDDFNITVSHTEDADADRAEDDDYKLVLKKAGDPGLSDDETGYDSLDEQTHTYTWILKLRDYQQYNIREHNYKLEQFDRSEHVYIIHNSDENADSRDDDSEAGAKIYTDDEGITITADAYPDDAPVSSYQTVELKNLYVNSGFITLNKIDSFTQEWLKGVKFEIRSLDEQDEFQLYRHTGSSAYSDKNETSEKYSFTEKVEDNIIETDSTGMIFLKLPAGTYMLREQTPEGYKDGSLFKIVVKDDKAGTGIYIESAVPCDENGHEKSEVQNFLHYSKDASVVTVRNKAEQLTSVTAKADMGDVKADSVTVELWCNGAKLEGSQYTQELNADSGWIYRWENLPLYTNGKVAEYSLRESSIGDTAYDPGVNSDGYADYEVTYHDCRYRAEDPDDYENLNSWNDPVSWNDDNGEVHYAKHALLVVSNALKVAEPQYVSVNVRAVWDDQNDQDGIRPENVDLTLLDEDGRPAGNGISLTSDVEWQGMFLELDKFRDGSELKYFINEGSFEAVDGYKAVVTGDMAGGFVVTFTHTPENVTVSGRKVWDDNDNEKGRRPESITANLFADGEKAGSRTVSASDADQNGNWIWSFGEQPKYRSGREIMYTVTEEETELYTATYTIDQGKPGDSDRTYVITNKYTPKETVPVSSSITDQIDVSKKLTGRKLAGGEFRFELLEGDEIVAEGSNDEEGNVRFGEIIYTEAGTHIYTVCEAAGSAGGVTYDSSRYTVVTAVTEQADGRLKVEHTVTDKAVIEFRNTYSAKPAAVSVKAVKHLTGKPLSTGQFSFQLKDSRGNVIDEAKNGENGVITFRELTFDKAGEYGYTISEVNDGQADIKYDDSVKEITVRVTDDGKGALTALIESEDQLSFNNTYEAGGAADTPDEDDPGTVPGETGGSSAGTGGSGAGTGSTDGAAGGNAAATGDSGNMMPVLALMLTAAAAGLLTLLCRKRRS